VAKTTLAPKLVSTFEYAGRRASFSQSAYFQGDSVRGDGGLCPGFACVNYLVPVPGESPSPLPINGVSGISPAAVFYRNRAVSCRKQFRLATKYEINNGSAGWLLSAPCACVVARSAFR